MTWVCSTLVATALAMMAITMTIPVPTAVSASAPMPNTIAKTTRPQRSPRLSDHHPASGEVTRLMTCCDADRAPVNDASGISSPTMTTVSPIRSSSNSASVAPRMPRKISQLRPSSTTAVPTGSQRKGWAGVPGLDSGARSSPASIGSPAAAEDGGRVSGRNNHQASAIASVMAAHTRNAVE